jgi:hypothetical protein
MVIDLARERVVCVREDHATGTPEVVNTIAAVPLGRLRLLHRADR